MRLVVSKGFIRRTLQWAQYVLIACAVLLLGYCAYALGDSWVYQRRQSRDLDLLRAASFDLPRAESSAANAVRAAAMRGLIGRLEIPRLLLSVVVVEGTSRTNLRRVVGHIPGTALPGQPGNVGLAGHRDSFFRPLKDLRVKDEIRFSTPAGDYNYEVESLRVVDPDDVGVLAPSEGNVLTMVTCYPFYFVGPAPKRWIVRARQVVR
jgi:sortase A